MTVDKITNNIIFNEQLDAAILRIERKFKDNIFHAKDIVELDKAEDNFLKALKEVIIYGKNEIK